MKKNLTSVILILFALVLLSIPSLMVYFYRMEFEKYEIEDIDLRLANIQSHSHIFYEKYSEDENEFLKALLVYLSKHSDYGSLILLDEDYDIVFPLDSPSREAREALAEEFAGAIQQGTLQTKSYFDTEDERSLRINYSSLSGKDAGLLYAIAYYDTAFSSARIDHLETIYLQIAVFSLVFFVAVLLMQYWNYRQYMRMLSDEILQVRVDDIRPLAVPASIGITDTVRQSINTMLERINRNRDQRGTFLRSAIHFMRNRLMAADGYAQGIETGVFSPGDAALKIRMENTAIEELLNNTAVNSYLQERTMPEYNEILYVASEITECINKSSFITDHRKITVSLLPCDSKLSVKGTKSLMETVLSNLLSNAVRYAASKVTFSVEETADQVTVRVEDDGKGIRDSDLQNIFKPMYKGPGGNMGIGLSVAQASARYMGGNLEAENAPNGGAVFIFSLPK